MKLFYSYSLDYTYQAFYYSNSQKVDTLVYNIMIGVFTCWPALNQEKKSEKH